jgi:hypothetical protein
VQRTRIVAALYVRAQQQTRKASETDLGGIFLGWVGY